MEWHEKTVKKQTAAMLRSKMVDFKQFAITLLCVGSFFYIGTILPTGDKAMIDTYVYFGSDNYVPGHIHSIFLIIQKNIRRSWPKWMTRTLYNNRSKPDSLKESGFFYFPIVVAH
ncbi:YrhC family protein [Peribacillus frigoritolerans]|nr:YrhC family protein [Peribacillus frigoritolerans]